MLLLTVLLLLYWFAWARGRFRGPAVADEV